MPLFQCRECGCVENTACAHYAVKIIDGQPVLCSECDPNIAKWHGYFPKKSAVGMFIDNEGFLWSPANVDTLPKHKKILGVVLG